MVEQSLREQLKIKVANSEDKEQIFTLMKESAKLQGYSEDNFTFAADYILKDIHNGFFIYAYLQNQSDMIEPAGFMLFTYEWSDWRDGLFFWMQNAYVRPEYNSNGDLNVLGQMCDYLQTCMKERGSCGIRIYYEKRLKDLWVPVVNQLKLNESHYYIYHVDTKDEGSHERVDEIKQSVV